jgi:hypothetical protein
MLWRKMPNDDENRSRRSSAFSQCFESTSLVRPVAPLRCQTFNAEHHRLETQLCSDSDLELNAEN